MSPKESERLKVFADVAVIRQKLQRVADLKYIRTGEEPTIEEKLLETIFENQVLAAKSEFIVELSEISPLLDKVDTIMSWVIENPNVNDSSPNLFERRDGQFEAVAFVGEISPEAEVDPKLSLTADEKDFTFNVDFWFSEEFSMIVEFSEGEDQHKDYYSVGVPLTKMTDVEHSIISYYLDKYIEEIIQAPQIR